MSDEGPNPKAPKEWKGWRCCMLPALCVCVRVVLRLLRCIEENDGMIRPLVSVLLLRIEDHEDDDE